MKITRYREANRRRAVRLGNANAYRRLRAPLSLATSTSIVLFAMHPQLMTGTAPFTVPLDFTPALLLVLA